MREEHDRAFKEWAVVCEALKAGRQIVLLRKGGIHEEDGVFRLGDPEFFLLPTYEHQDAALLQPQRASELERIASAGQDPASVHIDAYAVVTDALISHDEQDLCALSSEYVWNERYVRQRLDYNPYDPLYVLLLRTYVLPEMHLLPMMPDYQGCKSWVTLDRSLPTAGAVPAIADADFEARRAAVMGRLRVGQAP